MSLLTITGIACGLALDACAVALAASVALRRVSGRQVFRFAFHFGLFQALMPIAGWYAGGSVVAYIQQWDHWIACSLLFLIGGKSLYEALTRGASGKPGSDPTCGYSLVALSVATSIDALAVGLSFAMLRTAIWLPAVLIGLVTAALVTAGMLLGGRLGARAGKGLEVLGGLVLMAIGVKIVIEHLTA
jgi:putative Mn2+ efflux pump MntP